MSDYFAESGYKFILAVGLLVGETPRLKTVCAERGGVEVVLECLKQRKRSSSVCKWGLWALMVRKFEKFLLYLSTFFPTTSSSPSQSSSASQSPPPPPSSTHYSSSSFFLSFAPAWSLSPQSPFSTFSSLL